MADLEQNEPLLQAQPPRRPSKAIAAVSAFSCLFLLSLAALIFDGGDSPDLASLPSAETVVVSRGKKEGVSEKVFQVTGGKYGEFVWTNDMLRWQRTGYHFQPQKNWMNDPDGWQGLVKAVKSNESNFYCD